MIPKPNLDDRTHKQIVDEAIRLIPQYCPEWTNHNPNDPGIAMIELFAWMMEMGLYRLNRVPEKTYLTLMELIGMRLRPPQSSKVLASFALAEGKKSSQRVPAGTQAATAQSEEADSIVFETARALLITDIQLVHCVSVEQDRMNDNTEILLDAGSAASVPVFQSHNPIERFIYIGDENFALLKEANTIILTLHNSFPQWPEITRLLDWEYYNGHRWVTLEPAHYLMGAVRERNTVEFQGPIAGISPCQVEEKENIWIRARLTLRPEHPQQCLIDIIKLQVSMTEQGLPPELCYSNIQSMIYETLDLSKDFMPFLGQPKFNDAFYIASQDVFSKSRAAIQLSFTLSKTNNMAAPEASEDLILSWEYWDGQKWNIIGQSTHEAKETPEGEWDFLDSTAALTKEGVVGFQAPADWTRCEVNNQDNYWLRARIHTGDFGVGGSYAQDEQGRWVWSFDRPLRPPLLSRMALKYLLNPRTPQAVSSYNDYQFAELTEKYAENFMKFAGQKNLPHIEPFQIKPESNPMCYFGFNRSFPTEENQIYFLLKDSALFPGHELSPGKKPFSPPVSLAWEYWNGQGWQDLGAQDQTLGLSRSGFLNFQGPRNIMEKDIWGRSLCWIRARLETGSYEQMPYLNKVLTNTVEADSQKTIRNEMLGSSDGTPDQVFALLHSPVMGRLELWAAENEYPSREDAGRITQAGDRTAIREEVLPDGKRIWVRWQMVEGFYESGPGDRHYVLDSVEGKIHFGDGFHGRIPCEGKNNILADKYCIGGGAGSNVGVNTITVMKKAIPYISRVWNAVPSEGGADAETVEEAKFRAPHFFKHRFRAVTADDYEWLAREASNLVARARCLPAFRQEGEITVVIVPKAQEKDTLLTDRLAPTRELLKRVHEYLDERRLLTTRLNIVGFKYVDVSIRAEIVLKSTLSDARGVKTRVEEKIRTFLHPLYGGPDGQGWPFGMAVSKSDVYMALEKIEGVYYIAGLQIRDEDRGVEVEKLLMPEDTFAYPAAVNVMEKLAV